MRFTHKQNWRLAGFCGAVVLLVLLFSFQTAQAAKAPAPIDVTYTMSNPYPQFSYPLNAAFCWGNFALKWKSYFAAVQYNDGNANLAPCGFISPFDADNLNDLEADACVFPQGDPIGGWVDEQSFEAKEHFTGVGIFVDLYESPVFTELTLPGEAFPEPVGIQEITFSIDSNNPRGATNMEQLCKLQGWDRQNRPSDVSQVAEACVFFEGQYFDITSIELVHWDNGIQRKTLNWTEMENGYNFASIYIGDPDFGDGEGRTAGKEAAACSSAESEE